MDGEGAMSARVSDGAPVDTINLMRPAAAPLFTHRVRAKVGEAHHGLAALVVVGIEHQGELVVAHGVTRQDALRRLARRVEEATALGPLEREPRRAALEAMYAARRELWYLLARLRDAERDRLERPSPTESTRDALDALYRALARLEADIGLDVDAGLEDAEGACR